MDGWKAILSLWGPAYFQWLLLLDRPNTWQQKSHVSRVRIPHVVLGVSTNNGIPKSFILIVISIIFTIHFGGFPPIFGGPPTSRILPGTLNTPDFFEVIVYGLNYHGIGFIHHHFVGKTHHLGEYFFGSLFPSIFLFRKSGGTSKCVLSGYKGIKPII